MPPSLTVDTSEGRDTTKPLLFECAWEVANKGWFLVLFACLATPDKFYIHAPSLPALRSSYRCNGRFSRLKCSVASLM